MSVRSESYSPPFPLCGLPWTGSTSSMKATAPVRWPSLHRLSVHVLETAPTAHDLRPGVPRFSLWFP